jgi:hypothetical protein
MDTSLRSPATQREEVIFYVKILEKYCTDDITSIDLAKTSDVSESTWKRRRQDVCFILALSSELNRRLSYQKTDKTRMIWRARLRAVIRLGDRAIAKHDEFNQKLWLAIKSDFDKYGKKES